MDFKLILLLLGLGQLVVIVLYALWGFLGGLKRELKCTAVLFVILLLGWLIFSDPAMMMGIELPGSLLELLGDLGVKAETASIWEVILQVLQTKVPNGVNLFVEGREAYELAYDVVAGVLRGVGLILSTVGSLFLAATIRFISHFVKFFVSLAKKAKAKKALPEEVEETSSEEEPEQVVVLGGIGSIRGSIIAAIALTLIPELLRDTIFGEYRMLFYAIILIAMMVITSNSILKEKIGSIFGKGKNKKSKKGEVE